VTTPDSPAVVEARRLAEHYRSGWRYSSTRDVAAVLDGVLAELDEARRDVERLRARTHEIQAQEMTKRADLDSQIAEMRSRWQAAKRWTEDEGLLAEWAAGRFASSPFWGMASMDACDALMRLVAERDEARSTSAEWRCPSCGATTRARMADQRPRVWLEGDEVPYGTWTADDGGVRWWNAGQRVHPGDGPIVEVFVPGFESIAAAVAAERERQAAQSDFAASGDPPPPNPVPEPSAGAEGDLRRHDGTSTGELNQPASLEAAQEAPDAAVGAGGQSETGEGREAAHDGDAGADDPAARLRAEHDFVIARAQARRFGGQRCYGLSSDALAMYALGFGERPQVPGTPTSPHFWTGDECGQDYPADEDDLAACERTYAMAPPHLRERMAPVLEEFRGWVRERRNRHGEVVSR
jgi:hypothetical protein